MKSSFVSSSKESMFSFIYSATLSRLLKSGIMGAAWTLVDSLVLLE